MPDVRSALLDGDATTTGGRLVSTEPFMTHLGKSVAVHGTFATCPKCKEGGPALNNCEPAFTIMGKTVLVEGARVYCKCASKPYVIASQTTFTIEVGSMRQTGVNDLSGEHMLPESRQKLADTSTDSLVHDADRICPNMSNAEFQVHIMRLRDEALNAVAARQVEMRRWSATDQQWFRQWFGTTDATAGDEIAAGLQRMNIVLSSLTPANFIRYSPESMRHVGCVSREHNVGTVAEVCAPDTATHTIAIRLDFCTLRPRHPSFDSQLLTLVHEVSHFTDVFGSLDHWYSTHKAKARARMQDARTIENADNIAGYIVCSE
ncbi:conserved hypothetical protein [Cupriavidus taiwanensis]|uniref:Lysine-specific metallo-endopeptidase domain-containing protein n=1 Tax=Cupriavidus taiwanensis TaxID=164546 RepID=A0A975X157_9BURK|nr:M35 family metallo-endopeptidase [Cupriavidus taiwanensis]SOY50697.1 conserved hypothetical protein [Cupriavidus taiwanensis]